MSARPAKLKIVAVSGRDLAPFLHMLGIDEVYMPRDSDEARSVLEELASRSDVGVIVVEKSVADMAGLESSRVQRLYPAIVVVPGPRDLEAMTPEKLYRHLIRRFVGVEVAIE